MLIDPMRHVAVFDPMKWDVPIELVGAGGVGSAAAHMLVRLGVGVQQPLRIHDNDTVERHNIGNQLFEPLDIGSLKARTLVERFGSWGAEHQITAHPEKVTSKTHLSGLVFICIDNMAGRKEIVLGCEQNSDVIGIIETRMDANYAISHAFDPHDELQTGAWFETWFADEEAENMLGCRGPVSVIPTVWVTAALAVQQFLLFSQHRSMRGIPNKAIFDMKTLTTFRTVQWGA